jgi:thiol-disulfide isomerase/thioredoxin
MVLANIGYFYAMRSSLCLVFSIFVCNNVFSQQFVENGRWHADLQLNDSTNLGVELITENDTLYFINAEERVMLSEVSMNGDSVTARFPFYDSELRFTSLGPILVGEYVNHARTSNNVFYFRALKDLDFRFSMQPEKPAADLSGRWELFFESEKGEGASNVAVLRQQGNRVTGTVLTATGDHRFLDGELSGNHLRLSTFNGAFAMLYDGTLEQDGTLRGHFYSGRHWHDTWTAVRNDSAKLPDPNSFTFLKPGYRRFDFSFPDASGKLWTLQDERFSNKVVVVQIMGTWCPNCIDETVFLNEYYSKNNSRGVEMLAVDFEKSNDPAKAWNNIARLQERIKIGYPVVFGGSSNRDSTATALPMLNRIAAFPTSIIIDKKGNVRKIHTGFSGPATGKEFDRYKDEFSVFIDQLLGE